MLFACVGFSILALAVVGSAVAAPGGSGHTVTQTDNFHGSNPSTGVNPAVMTARDEVAEIWGTFTEEDKLTGTDEGTGVVYTGHSTFWGNFNVNERNANDTFTVSIHASGSDGSSISQHEVMHESWNANGDLAVTFGKPGLTCG